MVCLGNMCMDTVHKGDNDDDDDNDNNNNNNQLTKQQTNQQTASSTVLPHKTTFPRPIQELSSHSTQADVSTPPSQ